VDAKFQDPHTSYLKPWHIWLKLVELLVACSVADFHCRLMSIVMLMHQANLRRSNFKKVQCRITHTTECFLYFMRVFIRGYDLLFI
jgi:hypothetical protein